MKKSFQEKEYFLKLRERKKESRVYTLHQMTGLLLAEILGDSKHKSLYMKLAKQYDNQKLLELAKDISTRESIAHKGAYFMTVLKTRKREFK